MRKMNLATQKQMVVDAVEALDIECFYPGVRRDIAARAGVPLHVVHAIMNDLLGYYQGGDGRLHAYALT